MSDLVSRLLAAIQEREREHHRVAEELRECARQKITVPNRDYLRATITDGLRLCQAHRDIVALCQRAADRSFNLVLRALAEGYGIEAES